MRLSNSTQSRSIGEMRFLADRHSTSSRDHLVSSPDGTNCAPVSSYSAFTFWKVTVSLPFHARTRVGTMKLRIGISSRMASSFPRGRLHFLEAGTHGHYVLAAEAAGSAAAIIAVLPYAQHDTRLPVCRCGRARRWKPVDADKRFRRFLAAGRSGSRPRGGGTDEDRVVVLASSFFRLSIRWPPLNFDARSRMPIVSSSITDPAGDFGSGTASCR
jgi:hypothetical protein